MSARNRPHSKKQGPSRKDAQAGPIAIWLLPIAAGLTVLMFGLVATADEHPKTLPPEKVEYVTAAVCAGCHEKQAQSWYNSHHGWALRRPFEENVLGDFDYATFEHKGIRTRFFRRDDKHFVETAGADGKLQEFEVKFTIGVAPLQQYLLATGDGRLQVLDIAWDTDAKRWFHVFPEHNAVQGDGLHWTGPYKNWQSRCAECHQTGFAKGYNPQTRSYATSWADDTVACEACHGPGSAHVKWAKESESYNPAEHPGLNEFGLSVSFSGDKKAVEMNVCAQCHSRREPFGTDSPPPGSPFDDHYNLALLRDGLYHADGQVNDEVYVHGSFLQSKMHAKGVTCTDCHDAHSLELIAEGNWVCTSCHSEAGNAKFSTLRKKDYDTPDHHHHRHGGVAAQCVSCHMPEKNFMVVDGRRDHSFRVPRPDLTRKVGVPNACNSCHEDQTAAWADETIRKWYPDSRSGQTHFALPFAAARSGIVSQATAQQLLKIAEDRTAAPIVRASALELLRNDTNPAVVSSAAGLVQDEHPLVRAAAAKLFRRTAPSSRLRLLTPLLSDKSKMVRIAAARELVGVPARGASEKVAAQMKAANQDFQSSLLARADFPETQMAIAGLALTMRNTKAAKSALSEALAMDPQLGEAWRLKARIEMAEGNPAAARNTLEAALQKMPGSPALTFSMARALVQQGRDEEALPYFAQSAELVAANETIFIEWAAALTRLGRHAEAMRRITAAQTLAPENPAILGLLATIQLRLGELKNARETVRKLTEQFPGYQLTPELNGLKNLP
ncbi:MAG: tetratricopeptide repeat protein [Hyphomicrobiales bacterium]